MSRWWDRLWRRARSRSMASARMAASSSGVGFAPARCRASSERCAPVTSERRRALPRATGPRTWGDGARTSPYAAGPHEGPRKAPEDRRRRRRGDRGGGDPGDDALRGGEVGGAASGSHAAQDAGSPHPPANHAHQRLSRASRRVRDGGGEGHGRREEGRRRGVREYGGASSPRSGVAAGAGRAVRGARGGDRGAGEADPRLASNQRDQQAARHHPRRRADHRVAIAASVPDPSQFRSGRQFAGRLGLAPRACGSGGKQRQAGIGKMAKGCIRRLPVAGETAMLGIFRQRGGGAWITKLMARNKL